MEGFAKGIFVPNILGEMEGFLIDGTSKLLDNFVISLFIYLFYLRVCVDVLLERVSNHDFVEVCSAVPHVELIEFYIRDNCVYTALREDLRGWEVGNILYGKRLFLRVVLLEKSKILNTLTVNAIHSVFGSISTNDFSFEIKKVGVNKYCYT